MTNHERDYRGLTIDADRDEKGVWRPIVEGDFIGKRRFGSANDALRAARGSVNMRLGKPKPTVSTDATTPTASRIDPDIIPATCNNCGGPCYAYDPDNIEECYHSFTVDGDPCGGSLRLPEQTAGTLVLA